MDNQEQSQILDKVSAVSDQVGLALVGLDVLLCGDHEDMSDRIGCYNDIPENAGYGVLSLLNNIVKDLDGLYCTVLDMTKAQEKAPEDPSSDTPEAQ